MKTMKKLLRKDLSTILGSGGGGCHWGGDSYNCQDDCQCAWGNVCQMYDGGGEGQCVRGGSGNPGGGCNPPNDCTEQPF